MKNRIHLILLGAVLLLTVAVVQHVYAAKRTLYVAICTEKGEHGGDEIAVGPQRSTFNAANEDGKAHERLWKGHRWRIGTN